MPKLEKAVYVPFGMKKPSERVTSWRAKRVSDTVCSQFGCETGGCRGRTSVGWMHALGFFEETVHFLEFGHARFNEYAVVSLENLL